MKMIIGTLKASQNQEKMKVEPGGNTLIIAGADSAQYNAIKSWNKMRWNRKNKVLTGIADLELLEKLAGIVPLPPDIDRRRLKLKAVQEAVDRERVNQTPKPLYRYPVKMPLYAHQVRGANMALLTFGWVSPERSGTA